MLPQYIRTLAGSFNTVYIDPTGPYRGKPTQIFPIGGLTQDGVWVPWQFNGDGTPVMPGQGSAPHHDAAQERTTPGLDQTLLSAAAPDAVVRSLVSAAVVTRVTGSFEVRAGGELVGSGRTGPGGTGPMLWNPPLPLAAGQSYDIIFKSRAGSPPQDVEAYVQAVDQQV